MNPASIFELSPSEKAVPVRDWQKQELARRKANLLKNPASARCWAEVKRSIRAAHGR
jgi:hypothetical protein